MKIMLAIIAIVLVVGFSVTCWLLHQLLDRMQYVKITADLMRAENIRTLHSIKNQVKRK